MGANQEAFEGLRAKLGDTLSDNENILAVAAARSGPRPLTLFVGSGSMPRAVIFGAAAGLLAWLSAFVALVPWFFLTKRWLLVVMPTRLIAIRILGAPMRLTAEIRSFDLREADGISVTSSFWSGWLVEVLLGGELLKYAVIRLGVAKRYLALPGDWEWTFEDFANALPESWQRARK